MPEDAKETNQRYLSVVEYTVISDGVAVIEAANKVISS